MYRCSTIAMAFNSESVQAQPSTTPTARSAALHRVLDRHHITFSREAAESHESQQRGIRLSLKSPPPKGRHFAPPPTPPPLVPKPRSPVYQQKPLPDIPIEHRTGETRGVGLDVRFPQRLRVHKIHAPLTAEQKIQQLTQQNGYLVEELAALEETRRTMKELQQKTQKAFLILEEALRNVSQQLNASERRLYEYWGLHFDDGSTEIKAF